MHGVVRIKIGQIAIRVKKYVRNARISHYPAGRGRMDEDCRLKTKVNLSRRVSKISIWV